MKKFLFLIAVTGLFISNTQAQGNYLRLPNGAQYKIITQGAGAKAKLEDVITFNLVQQSERDSIQFSTYKQGHPIQIQIKPSRGLGDLMYMFPLMAAKDSAIVRLPSDSVFAGHEEARPPYLPKGSLVVFVIKMERIQSLEEAIAERNAAMATEKAAMEKLKADEAFTADKYIADHKLVMTTSPSGLRYVVTKASTKPKIHLGDTLFVNYAGRTMNDKLFDTSLEDVAKEGGIYNPGRPYEPLKFILGETPLIKGWNEGLQLLSEGSKATFVIPSSLGYGDQGGGEAIPPYSSLAFDLEVVKAIKGKPPVVKAGAKKPVGKAPVVAGKTPPATTTPVKKPAAAPVKKPAAPVKK